MRYRSRFVGLIACLGLVGVSIDFLTASVQSPAIAQAAGEQIDRSSNIRPFTVQGRLDETSNTLEGDGSYYNSHTFEGTAGQSVTIEMTSNEFDTYLILLDPNGSRIAQNDDGNGTNSLIVIELPKTGTYTVLANSYTAGATGNYTLSLRSASVAQLLSHSRRAEAIRLSQQGVQQFRASQYAAALQSFQQALVIVREISEREGEGIILNSVGAVYRSRGQYSEALNYHQQALVISREVDNREGEGSALSSIGLVYDYQGRYPEALSYHQQALVIFREVDDREGEGLTLNNIGEVYRGQGQYPQALDFYQQALVVTREINNRAGESAILNNIGLVSYEQGQYPQALNFYDQALVIKREVNDRAGEGSTLNNIAEAYRGQEQYLQALNYYQQALVVSREVGDRPTEGIILGNMGIVYSSQGQYPQALDFYQQSLVITRVVGDRAGEGTTLNNIGVTLLETNQFAQASEQLNAAIEIWESLRTTEMSDAAKVAIFETQAITYNYLQQALIAQNKPEQALEAAERGRGRALVALLSEQPSGNPPSIEQIKQIARTQNATLVVYSQVYTIAGDRLLYAWVVKPTGEVTFRQTPLTAQDGQSSSQNPIALLNENALFRGSEPDATSELIAETRSSLGVGDGTVVARPTQAAQTDRLRQLHQLLIEPIADLLPSDPSDRVVFVPQGSLFLVPFAALQDAQERYLIEQHTISISPSIEVLALAQQQAQRLSREPRPDNVLIVGNPTMPRIFVPPNDQPQQLANLPGAEQEAEAIARFFDTQTLTGDRATETTVRQQMTQARIIHLATHGLLDYGNPQATGVLDLPGAIALAPGGEHDGLLTSAEISQMRLNADLVVLSACETGLGDIRGDGVVGLSRSLMQAGVPSVVVSLWSVPDAPTAELMTEFYNQLRHNPDRAQALRQAMLITMRQSPNPRDWAAFTLVGEVQ